MISTAQFRVKPILFPTNTGGFDNIRTAKRRGSGNIAELAIYAMPHTVLIDSTVMLRAGNAH
jgi:hypothetical protein